MAQNTQLVFDYGGHMWKAQMAKWCPGNRFAGVARLDGWQWIISGRGYVDIVPSPNYSVYGLVYEISKSDEARLDGYEGVPGPRTKKYLSVSFLGTEESPEQKNIQILTYVDSQRTTDGKPKDEYVCRLVKAFADALNEGVPEGYVAACVRSLT